MQHAKGYETTFVTGVQIVAGDEFMVKLPRKLLRGGRRQAFASSSTFMLSYFQDCILLDAPISWVSNKVGMKVDDG